MSATHLHHLAQLIGNDNHAATFQSLGQYRTALLKEISETQHEQPAGMKVPEGAGKVIEVAAKLCTSALREIESAMDTQRLSRGRLEIALSACKDRLGRYAVELRHAAAPHPVSGSAEERFEHYLQNAIDNAPEPLRRLGEYLPHVLDEDEWATAERMLSGAVVASTASTSGCEGVVLVSAVDAAMVEMQNISPPLRRSECERLIRAALTTSIAQQGERPS